MIDWTGDLDEDCIAIFRGVLLHAQRMDDGLWWWGIYDAATDEHLMSSNGLLPQTYPTGESARAAAVDEARKFMR